jgi:hypothetical protein
MSNSGAKRLINEESEDFLHSEFTRLRKKELKIIFVPKMKELIWGWVK